MSEKKTWCAWCGTAMYDVEEAYCSDECYELLAEYGDWCPTHGVYAPNGACPHPHPDEDKRPVRPACPNGM